MIRFALAFFFTFSLVAQPTIYLRSPGTAGFVVGSVSTDTPAIVQTLSAHGLNAGDMVTIWGVGATSSGSCISSAANGLRLVKTVIDSTHFSITDQSGADIATQGAWCPGGGAGFAGSAQAGGKVQAYTPVASPRGWLDGPTGSVMRKLALGTNNGLVSLVISGSTATATVNYDITCPATRTSSNWGICPGDKIGVWGAGKTAAQMALHNSGNPYIITAATSSTFSFTVPRSVTPGTYSASNNTCGPSADQDCLRISQLAWTGNVFWDNLNNTLLNNWEANPAAYRHVYDGGTLNNGVDATSAWAAAAIRGMADPSDTAMMNVARYCVNHVERTSGVNWTIDESLPTGNNNYIGDYGSGIVMAAAACYVAAQPYLTAAEKQTFADKMYNDVDYLNATPCNKAHTMVANETLASGTAQGGSSTSITLASGDTAADGYYINNVIWATVAGNRSFGLVTAYDATSKVATVSAWSNGVPGAGTSYSILATGILSGRTANTTATVTGYNTHFTTDFAVGDAIELVNNPYGAVPETAQSYITAINSDTSMAVINSSGVTGSTTVPSAVWIQHQWQAGDCGLRWGQNHWNGAMGAMPSLYPPNGGVSAVGSAVNQTPVLGSNNGINRAAAWTILGLTLADDDPRAVVELAAAESQFWDWHIRFIWNYVTGLAHSGTGYSIGNVEMGSIRGVWSLAQSVPALAPGMDLDGPWATGWSYLKMYATYPDRRWDGSHNFPWMTRWGASTAATTVDSAWPKTGWQINPGFLWAASAPSTRYFYNYMSTYCCILNGNGTNPWTFLWNETAWFGLLMVDPRISGSDYTVQPNQYLFTKTSAATACANTGWPCPTTLRADAVVSHTGWGSLGSPNRTATQVFFESRPFWGDHDSHEMGSLRVYKAGHLLNSDSSPPGNNIEQSDTTALDTVPKIGNQGSMQALYLGGTNGAATANITRWGSAGHGLWDSGYGDAASRYAYAMADMTPAYKAGFNRIQRHMIHFKKAGTEEILIQFDDIDVSNAPTQIETHIHYPQNGEINMDQFNEGNTTCPGAGGCAALDSTRVIQSLEDGGQDAYGDPARNYGVVSAFLSPGTIFVRDDGSSYPGGYGHTHRVSLCGGSSCGASVNSLEAFVVHKITASLTDTALNAKMLAADVNWAGVETVDASGTGGKVVTIARGGRKPFRTGVQTDHPGVGQYLIAGLQAGFLYMVYRNDDGTVITTQAVTDGDNSLYFEAPAGNYSIFPEGMRNLFVRPSPKAQAGVPFEFDFEPGGSAPEFQWQVSDGNLPPGLHLSTAGVLSGTASQSGTYTFTLTAQAIAYSAVLQAAPITVEVTPPPLNLHVRAITTSQAILAYGLRGLDATQPCTLTVSTQPDFSTAMESFTDQGGPAIRSHMVGAALQPSATYYAQAVCGESLTPTTIAFATPPPISQQPTTVRVSIEPPPTGATTVEVQYGNTPELGSAVTAACSGGCTVELPAMTDTLLYTRRVYRDAESRAVATSSIGVTGILQ